MAKDDFQLVKDFPAYISKQEITNVDQPFLVKGSKNVLIDESKRVSTRKGYTLFGAGKTSNNKIRSSYEWDTSSDLEIPLRSYKGELQAYFFNAWRSIKSGWLDKVDFAFTTWWSSTELIELLLFVNGNNKVYSWSGAFTKIRTATTTTLTKMYSLTDITFTFVPGVTGTTKAKILDANSLFVSAGFSEGDSIVVSGSTSNDGTYIVSTVSAGEIELSILETLVTEASGASVTISVENKDTWAVERFLTQGLERGSASTQFDITNPSGTTFRYTWDGTGTDPVINATVLPVGYSVILDAQNFNAGNNGTFTVTGSGANYFEVTNASGVVESNKTIGTGTITFVIKKIVIDGVEYNYTGGEDTATLTGVSPDPTAITNGSIAYQAIRESINVPTQGAKNNLISVFQNQIYLGSKTNRDVYMSSNTDYTDFSFSNPRLPGEGMIFNLDNPPTCFMPQESQMNIGARKDDIYQIVFSMASDNQSEVCTADKYKTSNRQAPLSQGAVTNIKNSIAFITHEPSLDTLGRLEQINTPQSKPLSDIIKNDFETYDFTGVHTRYWRNNIYMALPNEGIVLIYDLENGLWQPPQYIGISRLAIINNELCGHSNNGNETYKLFDGYNDNGVVIPWNAVFAYQNYGIRNSYKTFDEFYVEVYMTPTKEGITITNDYDFNGVRGSDEYILDGTDEGLLFNADEEDASFGNSSLGSTPFGGQTVDEDPFLDGTQKYRVKYEAPHKPFFELRTTFSGTKKDLRCKIIAFGPNVSLSTNGTNDIKR